MLNDLSLEIPAGAIAAILGPNGAGQTTLLHVILGLLPPRAGQVVLDGGSTINALAPRGRSRPHGLVPQAEYIPFDFSVLEYALLGRSPYLGMLEMPAAKRLIASPLMFELVRSSDLQHRAVTEISGGERQMVMLAFAGFGSRAVLLDEPTSHRSQQRRVAPRASAVGRARCGGDLHDARSEAAIAIAQYPVDARRAHTSGSLTDVLTTDNLIATYGADSAGASLIDRWCCWMIWQHERLNVNHRDGRSGRRQDDVLHPIDQYSPLGWQIDRGCFVCVTNRGRPEDRHRRDRSACQSTSITGD
ncbi:MAG: ABC transporter ATP-binding protein [Anaerolineae bacterium]